jgi:hypothetical protein
MHLLRSSPIAVQPTIGLFFAARQPPAGQHSFGGSAIDIRRRAGLRD